VTFRVGVNTVLGMAIVAGVAGCRREEAPRPSQDIMKEKMSLQALFLTEKTLQEVKAPANTQPVENGETCWRAITCTHPDCPGEGKNGRPYLFINSKPGSDTYCPACLDGRDPSTLT